jgi:cell division protein FtsB
MPGFFMSILQYIPSWLKNKYFLSSLFFVCWLLFFDHNDLFQQVTRTRELHDLRASKDYYQQQIDETRKEVELIRMNAASLEKLAREKYMMKKDNEDLFIIPGE